MNEHRKILIKLTKDEKKLLNELSHNHRTNMTYFVRAMLNAYPFFSLLDRDIISDNIQEMQGEK
jgi:hypothetical protein